MSTAVGWEALEQACLPQDINPGKPYYHHCWGHLLPLCLLSSAFPLVTMKTTRAGFIALVRWALEFQEPRSGEAITMWGLTAKNSITGTEDYWDLWYIADSHSMTLLSKHYLDVSTTLLLALHSVWFGSDSVTRYALVIHKLLHWDKWVTDRYNTSWLSYISQAWSTRQVPHSLLPRLFKLSGCAA